ncbi:MAG: hypothetical protein IPM68_16720 [Flavobacteriales bacterium]|nr:hypothetical protein [Flavobacteriales bacterium]
MAHQSDVQVSDCRMQDIQPDSAYTLTGNGAGIFARGDQGYHFLRQQGCGMAGTPSFTSCRWGVYTEYMNVLEHRQPDAGHGYRPPCGAQRLPLCGHPRQPRGRPPERHGTAGQ